ncbi:MAG: hypothetical protein JNL97_04690, partial [Verrucomicrobiales bacterium]|nr:hypothetical protein [Verrucomicrobiales bacterium]
TDYTLELRARKIAGREGFLVLFHNADDEDRTWWNLGGWENARHGLEIGRTLDPKSGSIETGRWYAIKVQVRGASVKCWLDDRLIHDVVSERRTTKSLHASATRDAANGDLVLKVVNVAPTPLETELVFEGAASLGTDARAIVLTGERPTDENTLDEPEKVAPKTERFDFRGPRARRVFPANSFTVLRIPFGK